MVLTPVYRHVNKQNKKCKCSYFFSILVCEKRRKTLPSAGHKVIKKSGLQQVADHIKSLISEKYVTRRLGKGNIGAAEKYWGVFNFIVFCIFAL